MKLSAFVKFIELIIFQSERRSLKRVVSAEHCDRLWAFLQILAQIQFGGPQWSKYNSATMSGGDESETDLDSSREKLLDLHMTTNFRMTGCKISAEQ
jgi:hypothetical protein